MEVARRDTLEKEILQFEGISGKIQNLLEQIQINIYQKAYDFREQNTFVVDDWSEFKTKAESGGFILAHWDGTTETEQKIKDETKATIRSIPIDGKTEEGKCIFSGKPSNQRVVFAKAY